MDRAELTEKDLRIGVWTYGDVDIDKHNPDKVFETVPEHISDVDRLWINIGTITSLTEKERKAAKKEWLKILPTLANVRFLWVRGVVNQEFFDAICEMKWLEALCLKWTGIINLDKIPNLENLLHLFIGSSSKLQNIDGLAALKRIITLQVEGFKLIHDITPITKLTTLKGLHIQGDMWKKQYVDSLRGLERLTQLEYLSFDGTEVLDKNIEPITKLTRLKSLDIGYWWRVEDLIKVYDALPELKYGSVKNAVDSGDFKKYLRKI